MWRSDESVAELFFAVKPRDVDGAMGQSETDRMKLRHAAALAPVGWYLIAPGNKWIPDSGGALMSAQWFRLGSFETSAQCERARQEIQTAVAQAYEQERLAHRELTFTWAMLPRAKTTPLVRFFRAYRSGIQIRHFSSFPRLNHGRDAGTCADLTDRWGAIRLSMLPGVAILTTAG
jgi:hypothetical protein